jgi:hypothetical protein
MSRSVKLHVAIYDALLLIRCSPAALQVKTFREEFNLEAISVNSGQGGCTKEVMAVS